MANAVVLAPMTTTVRARWSSACSLLNLRASDAVMIESAISVSDVAQKGTTSCQKWERPVLPQTQRRLRK